MTDRTKAIYVRTNRRVQWQYSEYCGRWRTDEEAISVAAERHKEERFEYRIEDLLTGSVVTGYAEPDSSTSTGK